MKIVGFIWYFCDFVSRGLNKTVVGPIKRSLFKRCGKRVSISRRVKANGWNHIVVGNHVSIGEDCRFMTTIANIYIGDHVMFAPNVTVVTGGHRVDIPNKYMDEVTEKEKRIVDDQDVIFEGDNWIGVNAIILKGVTVGKGAVIGAGAIVTKNVLPNSIVVGNPAREIRKRF